MPVVFLRLLALFLNPIASWHVDATHMINLLVCQSPVVLQYVIVLYTQCSSYLLRDRHRLGKLIVRNLCKFRPMGFGDY